MNKYLVMLTFCVATQRISSKPLFDYNVNPEYDLVAQESRSSSNPWPSSEFFISPHLRYRHQARSRGHGRVDGLRKNYLPPQADDYGFADSNEDYSGEIYHSHPFHHYPHGVPPGQAKKHGHHNVPHYVIPPRFPPPPVYNKNFMNPWMLSPTTPKGFNVQQPPISTPQLPIGVPVVTTTPVPPSSTTADDQLMYDIDVRFGRE